MAIIKVSSGGYTYKSEVPDFEDVEVTFAPLSQKDKIDIYNAVRDGEEVSLLKSIEQSSKIVTIKNLTIIVESGNEDNANANETEIKNPTLLQLTELKTDTGSGIVKFWEEIQKNLTDYLTGELAKK